MNYNLALIRLRGSMPVKKKMTGTKVFQLFQLLKSGERPSRDELEWKFGASIISKYFD